MKRLLLSALPALFALSASAAWTVDTAGAPSGCTHVISDGNWQIGVYKYSDDNWNLGKYSGANGSGYVAGSGDLDLTGVEADCGVVIKAAPVSSWVLVAARKHAAEWKADARVLTFEGTEQATAVAAAKALGLTGVKPVGKWTTGTNGTKHWVVEELPAETMLMLK